MLCVVNVCVKGDCIGEQCVCWGCVLVLYLLEGLARLCCGFVCVGFVCCGCDGRLVVVAGDAHMFERLADGAGRL